MSKPVARYAVTYGLGGCYLPDWHGGAFECHTRRELADHIRSTIRLLDLPANLFEQTKIRNLWAWIKRYGSSSAHFYLHHGNHVLSFHGLTEAEYAEQSEEI